MYLYRNKGKKEIHVIHAVDFLSKPPSSSCAQLLFEHIHGELWSYYPQGVHHQEEGQRGRQTDEDQQYLDTSGECQLHVELRTERVQLYSLVISLRLSNPAATGCVP